MKSSEYSSNFKFDKVTSSGCQLMRPIYHKLNKSIFLESHSKSRHLSNSYAPINHMIAPCIHDLLPLRKLFRWLIWIIIFWVAHIPKISPFRIMRWRKRCWGFILLSKALNQVLISFGFFFILGSDANFIIVLRINVLYLLSIVELFWSLIEIVLHHVEKGRILLLLNSWIFDYQTSIIS